MLTGDKVETAINIGIATSLLTRDMNMTTYVWEDLNRDKYLLRARLMEQNSRMNSLSSEKTAATAKKTLGSAFDSEKGGERDQGSPNLLSSSPRNASGVLAARGDNSSPTREAYRRRRTYFDIEDRKGDAKETAHPPGSMTMMMAAGDGRGDGGVAAGSSSSTSKSSRHVGNVLKSSANNKKKKKMSRAEEDREAWRHPHALVVDGEALQEMLDPEIEELFLSVCTRCITVLCCRVTPHQKVRFLPGIYKAHRERYRYFRGYRVYIYSDV